jgi:hypothetical protein
MIDAPQHESRLVLWLRRKLPSSFAGMTGMHWMWLHAKVALAAWSILFVIFTPVVVAQTLTNTIAYVVAGFTLVGTIVAGYGLVRSTSPKTQLDGLAVERIGLVFMGLGPLVYLVAQITIIIADGNTQRIALAAFIYVVLAFIAVRLSIVSQKLARAEAALIPQHDRES